MPSKSPAQARLMRAVAHGWPPDNFKGPSVAVAKEFVAADQRKKKFADGGFNPPSEFDLPGAPSGPEAPPTDMGYLDQLRHLAAMGRGAVRGWAAGLGGLPQGVLSGAAEGVDWLGRKTGQAGEYLGHGARRAMGLDSAPNSDWSVPSSAMRHVTGMINAALPSSEALRNDPGFLPQLDAPRGLRELVTGAPSSLAAANRAGQSAGQFAGDWGAGAGSALTAPGRAYRWMEQFKPGLEAAHAVLGIPSVPGASMAVKPKGGNWSDFRLQQYLGNLGTHGNDALTQWRDKQLQRYMKTYMGTVEDPLLQLEQQGQLHMTPEQLSEASAQWGRSGDPLTPGQRGRNAAPAEGAFWYTAPGSKGSEASQFHRNATGRNWATQWENLADASVTYQPAKESLEDIYQNIGTPIEESEHGWSWPNTNILTSIAKGDHPEGVGLFADPNDSELQKLAKQHAWLEKAPNERVYSYPHHPLDDPYNFQHVLDYLHQSGLTPEQLSRVSVPDAVRATGEWSRTLGAKQLTQQLKEGEIGVQKAYPDGMYWAQLGEHGLDSEGKAMGHCVGSYCDAVKNRGTQILSLRDADSQPHVTVELRPGTLDPYEWFHQQPHDIQNEIHAGINDQATRTVVNNAVRAHPNYQADLAKVPPDIVQIKGKQNAAPVERYLPYVQDLVKSGNWGRVGDLKNTGLFDLQQTGTNPALYSSVLRQRYGHASPVDVQDAVSQLAATHPQRYVTQDEFDQLLEPHLQNVLGNVEGHASGGPVRMGNIRTAATAPTTNDPIIAHLMRHAPKIGKNPSATPLRYAAGGGVDWDAMVRRDFEQLLRT